MSEFPVHRLKRLAARVRPHHVAVAAVLAVLGLGLATVRAVALPGPQPVVDGDRLHIEVVAPVEPEIMPGSVMDVGDLVNSYEYSPPPRPAPEPAVYLADEEAFEAPEPRPTSKRYVEEAAIRPPPQPEASPEDGRDRRVSRWFGFDAPGRDFRAEREARRADRHARMERERDRREMERDRREMRRYRSDDAYARDARAEPPWRNDQPPPYYRD